MLAIHDTACDKKGGRPPPRREGLPVGLLLRGEGREHLVVDALQTRVALHDVAKVVTELHLGIARFGSPVRVVIGGIAAKPAGS